MASGLNGGAWGGALGATTASIYVLDPSNTTALEPLADIVPALGPNRVTLDTEGGVVYESVRPGDHEVLIFHPDSSWARLRLRLDSGSDWTYDFKIAGSRALGVRVLEESGKPIPPEAAVILATVSADQFSFVFGSGE